MNFVDKFEVYMEKEKGSSKSTLSAYVADIWDFTDFLKERGKEPEDAANADVAAYVMNLSDLGKSHATINRRLASLRAFYNYLVTIRAVDSNPTSGIKSAKVARRELETAAGKRDRAMLELMYATGIRASEACSANVNDIDLRIGFISVRSGGKPRMVPIGRPARAALKDYLMNARPELLKKKEDTGALFLSYIGERLTRQGVWKILKQRGDEAGLTDRLSPQILRNSFAAHMVQNGADIKSLQDIIGHEDITATRIYLSLTKNRIIDVYDKAFPRA